MYHIATKYAAGGQSNSPARPRLHRAETLSLTRFFGDNLNRSDPSDPTHPTRKTTPLTNPTSRTLKLGLIGDNIAASSAPHLHRCAGRLCAVDVSYDLLVPREMGLGFEQLFGHARATGYHGLNITYPYKERAAALVHVADPLVQAIGAVNTIVFGADPADRPQGFNTDYTGFMVACRQGLGHCAPGTVCMIGAGGVGKAIGFGLLGLGADCIRVVDLDPAKAHDLAAALSTARTSANTATRIEVLTDPAQAARGADGLINCTPLGMVGIGGTPLPKPAMAGASWAFDAVYTPVDTNFLRDAQTAGLTVISGYELFFGQGVDAWTIFTGLPLDPAALRAKLQG